MLDRTPQPVPAQPEPVKVHVTPRFLVSLPRVAMNRSGWPSSKLAVVGVTSRVMAVPPPPQPEINAGTKTASSARAKDAARCLRPPCIIFAALNDKQSFMRAYAFDIFMAPWIAFRIRPAGGSCSHIEPLACLAKLVE